MNLSLLDDVLQIDLLGPEEQNIEMNVLISNITDQTCRTKTTMTFRKDGFLMFIMRLFTGLDVELSNTIHYYRTKRTILS